MGELIGQMQTKIKNSSTSFFGYVLKVVTGLFVGLTFSLIGEQAVQYGSMAFWFVVVMGAAVFLRLSKNWSSIGVLVFNVLFVLVGMLLRMYIIMAP